MQPHGLDDNPPTPCPASGVFTLTPNADHEGLQIGDKQQSPKVAGLLFRTLNWFIQDFELVYICILLQHENSGGFLEPVSYINAKVRNVRFVLSTKAFST